jgi:hypothetical protein
MADLEKIEDFDDRVLVFAWARIIEQERKKKKNDSMSRSFVAYDFYGFAD